MDLSSILNASLIYATFRSATPIIYAALCASLTQQADILNIGTEGIMLTGAFAAVAISYTTGSWVLAIIVAMLAGLLMAAIMAVANIKYGADICAIGMGINMFAIAITKFLMTSVFGMRGTFSNPDIVAIPRVVIPGLESIPFLNEVFNGWALTEWFVIVFIVLMWFLLFKTKWGLHLRSVGQYPMAAQTAGINVTSMKYQAILISGLIGGLAGAHLSLGYSRLFTENMTNNRGFMGVAAMFFGNAHPVWTSVGCLVFGLTDSIGARLQAYGIAAQLVLMLPYIVTIVVLSISMVSKYYTKKRRQSSLLLIR
ncbi:MAG: ABC transporter permease [Sphaerochaetaceae bacterium]|nr:ABC transporter permease [Sphaerochaetaceae bacterium]